MMGEYLNSSHKSTGACVLQFLSFAVGVYAGIYFDQNYQVKFIPNKDIFIELLH